VGNILGGRCIKTWRVVGFEFGEKKKGDYVK